MSLLRFFKPVVFIGLFPAALWVQSAFGQAKEAAPSDFVPPGLEVGQKAPPFALTGQDGKEHTLGELTEKGKVALVFYRSADW